MFNGNNGGQFQLNTNIQDYTTDELMQFANITNDDLSNPNTIIQKTNEKISQFPKVANFFQEIQNTLLLLSNQLDEGYDATAPAPSLQQQNWFENQAPKQSDDLQNEKITDRKQKIEVFGNEHVPMNRQRLGVNNSVILPISQDVLNPNLRNSTQRMVILDSEFRDPDNNDSSTNYTCNLSDTIYRAYSMRLYSFFVPYTWYVIDEAYGNTCFWIIDGNTIVNLSIASGNYTSSQFVTEITTVFTNAGFTFPTGQLPITYNSMNGKISFNLYNGSFNGLDIYGTSATFQITTNTRIFFFDFTGIVQCATNCVNTARYLNQTLGWIMGYRTPYIFIDPSGNEAPTVLDLNGTKYLLLLVDDFNQNHVNHGIVSITQLNNKFKLPSYYTPNMPYTCIPVGASGTTGNLTTLLTDIDIAINTGETTADNAGYLLASKYENDYTPTQIVLPSAPRVLTQSQLYTINEINKINNNNTNYLAKAPTSPDILSVLPVKIKGLSVGDPIIEFSGSLQDNIRNYFGPVNVERLKIKLLDDKGNTINLNGGDWCVQLIFDCLYQY